MKSRLLSRVERLEARMPANTPGKFRAGCLTPLPEDYTGERHIAVTREPTGSPGEEWFEFEERPGPAPPGSEEGGFTVCWPRDALGHASEDHGPFDRTVDSPTRPDILAFTTKQR
jgi:hypothetical protein